MRRYEKHYYRTGNCANFIYARLPTVVKTRNFYKFRYRITTEQDPDLWSCNISASVWEEICRVSEMVWIVIWNAFVCAGSSENCAEQMQRSVRKTKRWFHYRMAFPCLRMSVTYINKQNLYKQGAVSTSKRFVDPESCYHIRAI